jgi:tetratricopeptide (TPR) repeat protein/predicted Ser/Thr protein kinase
VAVADDSDAHTLQQRPSLRETLGEHAQSDEREPPRTLGRYMLLDRLGHGAMGAVYRAYDPQLDRLIAIKRLAGDGDQPAHLLREAQAIARLSHPNVVQVHDVGQDEQTGDVFIAMELVAGRTLRAWLREGTRDWREILRAFVDAGRGLQAAHEQGIVHRDFKPENVLVDRAGRVKVVDFGLAQPTTGTDDVDLLRARAHTPRASQSADSGADLQRTPSSEHVGTPAYMSPEQLLGGDTDPRADQFSFAVALFEALTRRLPFRGRTPTQYAVSVLQGPPPAFRRGSEVPRTVQRAIVRALARDPKVRFDTLAAMLVELERKPLQRSRIYALGGALLLGTGLLALSVRADRDDAGVACEASAARIEQTWNDEARARVHEAMERAGGTFGEGTAERAGKALDELAHRWSDARRDACLVMRRDDSDDARTLCVEHARGRVEGLVEALATADADTLPHAVSAVAAASRRIDACADPQELDRMHRLAASAKGVDVVAALDEARQQLALRETGRGLAALDELPAAELHAGVRFEVEVLRGRLLHAAGDLDGAEAVLQGAGELGVGRAHPLGAAEWNQARADLMYDRGDYDGMDPAYARAAVLFEEALGDRDPQALLARATRGHASYARGEYAAALAIYEAADRDLAATAGDRHPDRISVDEWIVETLAHLGRYDQAAQTGIDLRARLEDTLGPEHPRTLDLEYRLGVLDLRAGQPERALATFRRIEAIEAGRGRESARDRAAREANIGAALMQLQRDDEALRMLERALASLRADAVPDRHADVLAVRANLGALLDRRRAHAEAEPVLAEVLRDLDAEGLGSTSNALMVRLNLGRAQRALGHPDDAVDTLLVGIERAGLANAVVLRGRLRHALAEALDAMGRVADADAALGHALEDLADPGAATFRRAAESYAAERTATTG